MKASAFAVVGILVALTIKNEKQNYALLIGLCIGITILGLCMKRMARVVETISLLKNDMGGGGDYLGILIRVLGITYTCEFASGICRDAGYGFVASQLETLGKLSVMVSGLGILYAVIDQISLLT